jgi:DNA replication and repair protein RecF
VSLIKLRIEGLRNLLPVSIEPAPRLNYIVGPNASGKTSLLEAIYLLSRARSFRSPNAHQLVQFGAPLLTVSGQVVSPEADIATIGVQLAKGHREIHLKGRPLVSSAALMRVFPLLVIQPSGIALLEGPPKLRRNFMDFGVYHQDPDYLDGWRRYTRALHHRNALLRASRVRELTPWNHEMARYGIMVHEARTAYLEQLKPLFEEIGGRFFNDTPLGLRIHPGWDINQPLETILDKEHQLDLRYGHTQAGPHKGDFSVLFGHKPVKGLVSRGQMKLLVYALLLAQAGLMEERHGSSGCVLIDDIASELDEPNQQALMNILAGRKTQFFITATHRDARVTQGSAGVGVFEIAQGRIIKA